MSLQSNLFRCLQVLFYENKERKEWIFPTKTFDSTTSEWTSTSEPTSTAERGSSVNRNRYKREEGDPTVLLHTLLKDIGNSLGYDETDLPSPEQIVELLGKLYNNHLL